ncbi:MAG: MaoC/PaaZ C-terminal domain-containing protein [Acidimicrobiia bacterium]
MPLNTSLARKRYPSTTFDVRADEIQKYAAATNEDNPRFTGDKPVAPPAFPIVAAASTLNEVLNDSDLGANLARLIHGEQEHMLISLIEPGDSLTVETWLEAVEAGEDGESFTVATRLLKEGASAAELRGKMFIRGTAKRRPQRPNEPEETDSPEVIFSVTQKVDEDQASRYAEASGDDNPIHLDADFARNQAGLPGIILHGMCTMAFASKAVLDSVCDSDPNRLKRIKVRFARPVFPGESLTTEGWKKDEDEGRVVYGFVTTNSRGSAVLTDGEAEVSKKLSERI